MCCGAGCASYATGYTEDGVFADENLTANCYTRIHTTTRTNSRHALRQRYLSEADSERSAFISESVCGAAFERPVSRQAVSQADA
jgi:hypothetical protein